MITEPSPLVGSTTPSDDPPATATQRTAATVLRNKQERRVERLSEIRRQTADGTLVIRQMTDAEHLAASKTADAIGERNRARQGRRYRSPSHREA